MAHPKPIIRDQVEIDRLRAAIAYDPHSGEFRWKISSGPARAGELAGSPGVRCWRIRIAGKSYKAHHVAWALTTGAWPTSLIDHKNRDPLDNRFENLRLATGTENQANRAPDHRNTSGLKGVTWSRVSQRWQAGIKVNYRSYHLGLFDTREEAHAAYVAAAKRHFGEFARAA